MHVYILRMVVKLIRVIRVAINSYRHRIAKTWGFQKEFNR